MLDPALPDALKAFAQREFMSERLVWAARPDRRIHALLSFGIWIFAVPWTAFALFWISVPVGALYETYAGVSIGAPKGAPTAMMWVFALFGTPFVLIGFGMLAAPFAAIWKGWRTLYVLTDRRLAVLEGGRRVTVVSVLPGEISGFTRREGPDGRGTLTVHRGFEKDSDGDRRALTTELGVIDGVRRVEELLRGFKEGAVSRR
jgi:hypothetical protein